MITCRELVELLVDFVAGELPPKLQEHLEEHLQWCPPCMTYLETYRMTIRITRQLPCKPLPEALVQRLHAALKSLPDEEGGTQQA
jgi:anti-sigma factor RsiW